MCCERAERVEARKQRHRQALAARVEPQRRGSAQDADAVPAPDRRIVLDAFRVVPHAVGIDDVAAARLDDVEHQPVDVIRHARDHVLRRLAQPLRPMAPHQLVIAADAARGDDDRLRAQRERAGEAARARHARAPHCSASSTSPCTPSTAPPVLVSDVTRWRKRNDTSPRLLRRAHAPHERLDHARPGAPGDMKARHRVAVAGRQISAALGPADDRENLQALLRAARRASRPPRSPHRPRPSGAANDPRRGRSRPSRASPATRDRGCRGCACGAARASRRRTIRRTTRTPARRARPPAS